MSSPERLATFFNKSDNFVTRERIFFNRLSFDLKIAAARADYHLNLYEPDVDREGFDIIVEDEDAFRWYQTKAVLASGDTGQWEINVGFLRPPQTNTYDVPPVDAGRGGGVILIEIDDTTTEGQVIYSYTDFDIITAIAEGFLIERPYTGPLRRGPKPKAARDLAIEKTKELLTTERNKKILIPKTLFIRLKSPDHLLAVMGMRSLETFDIFHVRNAYGQVHVEKNGESRNDAPTEHASALHYHMKLLCEAQDQTGAAKKATLFDPFTWVTPSLVKD